MSRRSVVTAEEMARALTRIAHEIREQLPPGETPVLLGIPTRGVALAERLGRILERIDAGEQPAPDAPARHVGVGALDVTMFRDDVRRGQLRAPGPTNIPDGGVEDRVVVLVDDVIASGRTIRAALDAVHAIGRPRAVRLAVLVDRGHRELPIRPDYVGKNLPTNRSERVFVELAEFDGVDGVTIAQSNGGQA